MIFFVKSKIIELYCISLTAKIYNIKELKLQKKYTILRIS